MRSKDFAWGVVAAAALVLFLICAVASLFEGEASTPVRNPNAGYMTQKDNQLETTIIAASRKREIEKLSSSPSSYGDTNLLNVRMKMRYLASIIWSEHDGMYLARVSELPGCLADGQTPQEAIANLVVIAEEWIEVAKEEGREIPEPMTAERLHTETEKRQAQLQTLVQSAVIEAIEKQKREASSMPGWRGDPSEFELASDPRT